MEHVRLIPEPYAYFLQKLPGAFIFVGEVRYHLPLLPLFAILGAIGVSAAWERLRGPPNDTAAN